MDQPKGYVDPEYLELTARLVNQAKLKSYTQLRLAEGSRVLDVGCGAGIDTLALARLVGPSGWVAGIDYDEQMIAEADRRARSAGVSTWTQHQKADASSLPFENEEFHASRSERMFQHLQNPESALREMIRVTRPGGRIVVLDTDWGSMSVDSNETEIEQRLFRFHAEVQLHNGYSGRKLYRQFKTHGLIEIEIEILPQHSLSYPLSQKVANLPTTEQAALLAGVVSSEELERWHTNLEKAEETGMFFAMVNMVLVSASKVVS